MTGWQVRAVFTALLRKRPATAVEIAKEVSDVLRRNEEARIYHWHAETGAFPPRRPRSGFS